MDNKDDEVKELCEIIKIYSEQFGKSKGIFGIEEEADEKAKRVALEYIKSKVESFDRGFKGNTRRCSKCGELTQRYKGDEAKIFRFESGELKIVRSRYVCTICGETSFPLEEDLGLVSGKEQGKLREKCALIGVIAPYNKGPDVCKILLGSAIHAQTVRRLVHREAGRYETLEPDVDIELKSTKDNTLYLEVDGHMCPTREEKKDANDHGYREAKTVVAFNEDDVVEVSKDRPQIVDQVLRAKISPASDFMLTFKAVYERSNAANASRVVALADGARWVWNLFEEIVPEAIQILDFYHAKSYLYKAAELIYGKSPSMFDWVKKQEDLLFQDKISAVIENIEIHAKAIEQLDEILTYFDANRNRMLYGTFKAMNLRIGSGAVESAGKRISQGRIKGAGMRWNVVDLNKMLKLRCAWLSSSWNNYWNKQKLAA